MKKLVLAGGTGFLGNACIDYFKTSFDEIIVLTRSRRKSVENVRYVQWDAKTLANWSAHINGSDILINMTGRSVDCRYTDQNKDIIMNSRIDSTRILGQAVSRAEKPPKIWLNSSTATIYRHSLDTKMGEENGQIGTGFSVSVAEAWEKSFFSAPTPNTRKIALRTSIVLGKNGGALQPIKNLAKIGFGGKQGKGNQKFSWIHIDDFLRALSFIIETKNLDGPVNIVSQEPVTNAELMRQVRKTVGIPFGFPLPKVLLEIGSRIIQTETELVLKSRNVIPHKLLQYGFEFEHKTIESALEEAI